MSVFTVFVVDDRALRSAAVRAGIARSPDFRVVEPGSDNGGVTATARRLGCELVVLTASDYGIECCREIKASGLATRVLVLGDDDAPELLVAAVEAGADGYVTTNASMEELHAALATVATGRASIPDEMLGTLLRNLIGRRRERSVAMDRYSRLSEREREVLGLLAQGLDKDEIARELVISPHTARTHIQNVLTRLGVHSRLEAVAFAVKLDLTESLSESREDRRSP